jgi:transposase
MLPRFHSWYEATAGLHGDVVATFAPQLIPRAHHPRGMGRTTGGPTAMDIVGLDLHTRQSQLAIKAPDGTISDHRVATTRDGFTTLFRDRPPTRILLEASTESEWVARHLERLGHEVIVADPNYAPMYAHRSRRTKTDRRDAHALMTACETGTYRPAHRLAESRRHVRAELAVRDALVRTRSRYATLAKTLVRRDGFRVPSSDSGHVPDRVMALPLSPALQGELAPLLAVYTPLNEQISASEDRLAGLTRTASVLRLLTTVPGVGPVTAASFVSTIDDVTRFESAHHVEAYLGLVPLGGVIVEWRDDRETSPRNLMPTSVTNATALPISAESAQRRRLRHRLRSDQAAGIPPQPRPLAGRPLHCNPFLSLQFLNHFAPDGEPSRAGIRPEQLDRSAPPLEPGVEEPFSDVGEGEERVARREFHSRRVAKARRESLRDADRPRPLHQRGVPLRDEGLVPHQPAEHPLCARRVNERETVACPPEARYEDLGLLTAMVDERGEGHSRRAQERLSARRSHDQRQEENRRSELAHRGWEFGTAKMNRSGTSTPRRISRGRIRNPRL